MALHGDSYFWYYIFYYYSSFYLIVIFLFYDFLLSSYPKHNTNVVIKLD